MTNTEKRSQWVYLLPATHLFACLISLSGYLVPQLQILGIVWVFIVLIDLPVSAIFYALAWNHGVIAGIWVIVVGTWWWYFLGRKIESLINKIRIRTGHAPTL
jgi:hypothetical protein